MQNFTSPLSKVDAGNGMKFVIFDAPNDSNVKAYIKVGWAKYQLEVLIIDLNCYSGAPRLRCQACGKGLRTHIQLKGSRRSWNIDPCEIS